MRKDAIAFLLLFSLCLTPLGAEGEKQFKTKPGLIILGGGLHFTFVQAFTENGPGVLDLNINPFFGQFLTKDTMLVTHLDFGMQLFFPSLGWMGRFGMGLQGRYFFSTEEAVNFYAGLDVSFGLKLQANYGDLQEHLMTGVLVGLLIPLNDRVGLDLGLNPLFYIPLNNYEPFAMAIYLSVGIVSSI